jgi:tetratricopeptide (TPR) repeat protein
MNLMCLLLVMVMIVSAAAPVLASDEQDCFQGQEPALRIKGCSEIIQRAPHDATAYHNRAVAFGLTGDIDNAIADYTKVIEIAPSNASAYDNRGRAYASKGDYTRAVEDEVKAHALMAKAAAQPIVVTPKARKPTKVTASAPKTTKSPPKARAVPKANNNVAKEASESSWWSFLNPWSNSADQAGGKKAKR